jgi:hypothetical protein
MASMQVRNPGRSVSIGLVALGVACVLACVVSAPVEAAVFTCTINGRTVYQDIACPGPPAAKHYVEEPPLSTIARNDFRRLTANRPAPVVNGNAVLSPAMIATLVVLVRARDDATNDSLRLQANLRAAAQAAVADPSTPEGAAIAREGQAALDRLRPQFDAAKIYGDAISRQIATLCPHGLLSMPGKLVCN